MLNGLDKFIRTFEKREIRFGLLTNHAALAQSGNPAALELLQNGFSIQKIFSPEHGVSSQAEDGQKQLNGIDLFTQLPVISLYGDKVAPDQNDLSDIDILLIDLPNIGCRFYTYLWSLSYALEACSKYSKEVIILDRPNQRSGNTQLAEGPLLDESCCSSFLGRWRMPLTHGFSYGQLAKWFNHERCLNLNLEVFSYEKGSLSFTVPPSPALADQQSIWLYPFTGLFEGVNVSIGRGTSFPFRVIGAPWIDPAKVHADFKAMAIPGVTAYPYVFKPMWSSHAGKFCNGLYFSVDDPDLFSPVTTGLLMLRYFGQHYEQLQPGTYPTIINPTGQQHLDFLLGIENSYRKICMEHKVSTETLSQHDKVSSWIKDVNSFLGL